MKKFKRTSANLPDNERIIGGDAPRSAINQDRKKTMQELIAKDETKIIKGKENKPGKG